MPGMNPEWTRWAKVTIRALKDGGYLVYPVGAAFKVDKTNHKLVTICELPGYHDSPVDRTNRAVFDEIGYTVVRDEPVPSDMKETVAFIQAQGGTGVMTEEAVQSFAQLFKVEPSVVHTLFSNKTPINPVTIRGYNDKGNGPRAIAIGRLWITSNDVSEGQHKFDPKNLQGDLDKTMQFVCFEEITKLDVLSTVVGNEDDFVKGFKELRQTGQRHFILKGNPSRGEAQKRDVSFTKMNRDNRWLMVVHFYEGEVTGPVAVSVQMEYSQFTKAMGHLFVRGELVVPEDN